MVYEMVGVVSDLPKDDAIVIVILIVNNLDDSANMIVPRFKSSILYFHVE